jgi:plastocyanin
MRSRGVLAGLCAAVFMLAAIAPSAANARTQTFKLKSQSFLISGFQTIFPKIRVPTPRQSGYITRMNAKLYDERGRQMSIRNVMLHHIVFITSGAQKSGSCPGRGGEPFWGSGEEHEPLKLPEGYGYKIGAKDTWRMQTMLMSHSLKAHTVHVVYTVRMVIGATLKRVKPLWLRANGCAKNPSYDIEGDQPPGTIHTKSSLWRMPVSGRIVSAGAHLHGSSYGMVTSQPRCKDRTLFDQKPLYGFSDDIVYRARPVLHEPGPIATGMYLSETGIPVRKGEMLKVTGYYDAAHPHPRVMAITHVYVAVDNNAPRGCGPLPKDGHIFWTRKDGRTKPPIMTLPINGLRDGKVVEIDRPLGPESIVKAPQTLVDVGQNEFSPSNISVARGTNIVWKFTDAQSHNILLASGPRLVASTTLTKGAKFEKKLYAPGEYKLFCYLHPITMTQVITVRP